MPKAKILNLNISPRTRLTSDEISATTLFMPSTAYPENPVKTSKFFEPKMVTLLKLIRRGKETKAQLLIEEESLSLNVHGEEGITPLLWLIMKKDKKSIRLALKLGADPDFTAINIDYKLVRQESGYRKRVKEEVEFSPLSMVAGGNDDEYLEILLEAGADPNSKDYSFNPALFSAIDNRKWSQIELLLKHGANLNSASIR